MMKEIKALRIRYREIIEEKLIGENPDNETISLHCSEIQLKELNELYPALHPGVIFNLLNAKEKEPNLYEAEFIIFEPDYLMDISSLAECFRPYGSHFLNYALSRLQIRETTSPILLGNIANFFIDEFVNEDTGNPVDYLESLKKLFQSAAFELSVCEDLKNPRTESEFFNNCQKHFNHIRSIINALLPKAGIDKEKIILEPSFISNALGLQGRLDILLSDYSAFIELKSGKATEDFRTGGQFVHSAINHYIQMILYLALLEFNLDIQSDDVKSYLLYSKYPVLSKERHSREHLQEALSLRNKIVVWEYELQRANDISITSEFLSGINSQNLNTKELSGNFFENYLAPSIDKFSNSFSQLKEDEKVYFIRIYTFIIKELWLSKVGEREYEGIKKAAVLWNAPMDDKLTAGEILYDLQIIDNQAASESHDITLQIPEYEDLYLPNFRPGDAIVLYERNSDKDNLNNRQVFKGSIELLEANRLKIRLRYRQKNISVWNEGALYAVMHDYMDTTYIGMLKALSCFTTANPNRRDLLLCKRDPETNYNDVSDNNSKENDILSKVEASKDCFLILGPPGTGKTSIVLKNLVEKNIQDSQKNILLLSYTNRAVDEICSALLSIDSAIPFIRIGNELNCAQEYRSYLLESHLKYCTRRSEVTDIINNCKIFVGTVASVWNKPELFQLKQFDLAIIDEATQLLEPHLLGVLCSKNKSGENAIKKFVLIGDHKQLPAIVLQTKEESGVSEIVLNKMGLTNLSNSLFERLYRKYSENNLTASYTILSKQGRMHPDISAFPSTYFYNDHLESVGLPHQLEKWDNRKRLNFHSIIPSQDELSDKINMNEASEVVDICMKIYKESLHPNKKFNPRKIGIITPYRNQIALIRHQLQKSGIPEFSEIIVDTVERFQGSQRDIIIYSFCVKTISQLNALPNILHENGKIIDRKLNVALTRAREQLYIIGNRELLSQDPIYKTLIDYILKRE